MTNNLHAHMARTAWDCDGRFDMDFVMSMTDEEKASEFGDLDFENRVVGRMVSFAGMGGNLTVTVGDDWKRAEWREQTEEGGIHYEALFCGDDCDTGETSQRDHTAEAMGY